MGARPQRWGERSNGAGGGGKAKAESPDANADAGVIGEGAELDGTLQLGLGGDDGDSGTDREATEVTTLGDFELKDREEGEVGVELSEAGGDLGVVSAEFA
jgi:hypothetical protein